MEIDRPALSEDGQEALQAGKNCAEDELAAQYEMVENVRTENEPPVDRFGKIQSTDVVYRGVMDNVSAPKTQATQGQVSKHEIEQLRGLPRQVELLQSQVSELAQKGLTEKNMPSENSEPSSERRKLENRIRELEEHIRYLLTTHERVFKQQAETEARYNDACAHIKKESDARREAELNLRTDIATAQGQFRKEKERAQKFMKTMADMQSADPFKLDNAYFKSGVEALRYDIKNWARNQRLVLNPNQNMITSVVRAVSGSRERGPNYEFLSSVVPYYLEYTSADEDFRWLLQAYVWKRIVELVWDDDLWAGPRKKTDDNDTENRLIFGYYLMKGRLEPDDRSSKEYITQYHQWRSSSARILDKQISKGRRAYTIALIRDDIVKPLFAASGHARQDIELEDLESIIESAIQLAANMAQQRANFVFELIPISAYGRAEFVSSIMTDPFPLAEFDRRTQNRVVHLMLAPRLLKYGTSEGTEFETHVQLLEAEVETKIVSKKFSR